MGVSCKKDPPAPLPTADFYVNNNGCLAPCSLYFFDQSANAATLNWTFGNGLTSTQAVDTVLYDTSGAYEVWLYVANADAKRDSVRKFVTVTD